MASTVGRQSKTSGVFFFPFICTSALGKTQNCAADRICFIPEERADGRGGDRHVNSLHRGSKGTGLVTFFFFFFFFFLFYMRKVLQYKRITALLKSLEGSEYSRCLIPTRIIQMLFFFLSFFPLNGTSKYQKTASAHRFHQG